MWRRRAAVVLPQLQGLAASQIAYSRRHDRSILRRIDLRRPLYLDTAPGTNLLWSVVVKSCANLAGVFNAKARRRKGAKGETCS